MNETAPLTTVLNENTGSKNIVNEWASELDIRNAEPKFFDFKHGKRETYTMYRGRI